MKKLIILCLIMLFICTCAGEAATFGCDSCYCACPGVIGVKPMARYCFDCGEGRTKKIREEAIKDIAETCGTGFNIIKEEFGIIHFECQKMKVKKEK